MILDLDGVAEPRPTWRQRWLRPLAAASLLGAVLLASFARIEGPPQARPSVLAAATSVVRPARVQLLPAAEARLVRRVPLSGVTGLTHLADSEGFRDVYRLSDGRTFTVVSAPDGGRWLVGPALSPDELGRLDRLLR